MKTKAGAVIWRCLSTRLVSARSCTITKKDTAYNKSTSFTFVTSLETLATLPAFLPHLYIIQHGSVVAGLMPLVGIVVNNGACLRRRLAHTDVSIPGTGTDLFYPASTDPHLFLLSGRTHHCPCSIFCLLYVTHRHDTFAKHKNILVKIARSDEKVRGLPKTLGSLRAIKIFIVKCLLKMHLTLLLFKVTDKEKILTEGNTFFFDITNTLDICGLSRPRTLS